MSYSGLSRLLGLVASSAMLLGCTGGSGPAKSQLDSMTPEQQKATVEQTIQKSMDENKKAMEQQGLEGAPPGVGFQPPESMKKYMNKQGGGAGTSAPGGGTGTSAPPSGGGAGSEQKKD